MAVLALLRAGRWTAPPRRRRGRRLLGLHPSVRVLVAQPPRADGDRLRWAEARVPPGAAARRARPRRHRRLADPAPRGRASPARWAWWATCGRRRRGARSPTRCSPGRTSLLRALQGPVGGLAARGHGTQPRKLAAPRRGDGRAGTSPRPGGAVCRPTSPACSSCTTSPTTSSPGAARASRPPGCAPTAAAGGRATTASSPSPSATPSLVAALTGQSATIVPNGVDTAAFAPQAEADGPPSVLFTGTMNYRPNGEGGVWLARDVWPLVRAARPDARLCIAGRHPPEDLQAFDGRDGIEVAGEVPDMRPLFAAAHVVAVPIHDGGGSRLKVLEAAATGRAMVSTTVGAEGTDLRDGEHLVLADDPAAFAGAARRPARRPRAASGAGLRRPRARRGAVRLAGRGRAARDGAARGRRDEAPRSQPPLPRAQAGRGHGDLRPPARRRPGRRATRARDRLLLRPRGRRRPARSRAGPRPSASRRSRSIQRTSPPASPPSSPCSRAPPPAPASTFSTPSGPRHRSTAGCPASRPSTT